jgi:chemotaxis protein methyltransferase CheR
MNADSRLGPEVCIGVYRRVSAAEDEQLETPNLKLQNPVSEELLSRLSELVAARTALYFPRARWNDLERKAASAAAELGLAGVEALTEWLASSPVSRKQIEVLASHLTISETYFWREPEVVEAFEARIIPDLVRARGSGERRLRIWSAGCSAGEEPYSIAIALRRAMPAWADWHITILATDINPGMLRKAAAGVYGEWSFRNAPPWLKQDYFIPTRDGKREILPDLRKMVTFAYLNLAEDNYPSPVNNTNAMDVIFCRNVLMYFEPERARQIGENLHRSLLDGGWLIVGASELSRQLFPQFSPVNFPGSIVYRKNVVRRPLSVVRRPSSVVDQGPDDQGRGDVSSVVDQGPNDKGRDDVLESTLAVRALANQGRLAEALALCTKTIAAARLDAELHYLQATILQELNREEEAIAALRRALYLDPNFVPAYFALGSLALRRGDARLGRRNCEIALALLATRREEEVLPEAEGLTAGRFREIIRAAMKEVEVEEKVKEREKEDRLFPIGTPS